MHAIEFEALSHHHAISLPDSVPDGIPLRVRLLSQAPLTKPTNPNLKALFSSLTEGLTEADIARNVRDVQRSRVVLLNPFSVQHTA